MADTATSQQVWLNGGTYSLGNETFIKLIPRGGSGDPPRAYKVTLRALDIGIPLPAELEQTGPHFFKNRNSTYMYNYLEKDVLLYI